MDNNQFTKRVNELHQELLSFPILEMAQQSKIDKLLMYIKELKSRNEVSIHDKTELDDAIEETIRALGPQHVMFAHRLRQAREAILVKYPEFH